MSVENLDDLGGVVAFLGENTPDNCFYCNRPLAGLTAFWHGANTNIALHPDCAIALGARICRDGLNAKLLSEGKPITAGVGVGLGTNVE